MGTQRDQLRLWLVAILASLLINAVLLISMVGMEALSWLTRARDSFQQAAVTRQAAQQAQAELVLQALVQPKVAPPAPSKPQEEKKPSKAFARTSPNQENATPDPTNLIGERDTRATSEAAPDPAALPMPSQKGEKPRLPDELETTSSNYQKGDLAHDRIAQAAAAARPSPPPVPASAGNPYADPTVARASMPSQQQQQQQLRVSEGTPRQAIEERKSEALAQSPFPVDTPVKEIKASKGTTQDQTPPDQPEKEQAAREQAATEQKNVVQQAPPEPNRPTPPTPPTPQTPRRPAVAGDPGFRGNQHRTQISGSISRRGISAQDVKSTPQGRYYASLSRAIEQQWQLNCERNRDFIVPGMLRVRFVIGTNAVVKTVEFVDSLGTSAIQKGFTLKSIREADIPKFPADLKRELNGDELEVSYTFIF
jgi:hypothetical protein